MSNNQFTRISPAIWALFAVLIAVAGLGGYALGHTNGIRSVSTAAPAQPADTPKGAQAAPTTIEGEPAPAGKGSIDPVTDPSTLDAFIFGPGGEVKSQDQILNVHRRNAQDPFAIGALDAPVVISEFSDFECPFCARHANETDPLIIKNFVETGLVRIEWNDLPVNGEYAVGAAKAGRAAAAQGKFHEFKHALYARSKTISGHPHNDIDTLVDIAKEAGVPDLEKFRTQATDSTFDEVINNARNYAASLGVTGTPGFLVGEQFVSGAQPYAVFEQAINNELVKANKK
ncbi:MAG: thioredoxin domain-containing protein [Corynebacterium sp.]|uniref:DsbA family protein n=1 Tax=Corynebacterium sp. TaxID=1720 RepID=UPI0026DC0A64|nr:thioredoxin domain-containing protein [Corynebacterium sp.]MDO4762177.1 thioredoxin domain-containing protein [Corynebacterium sp.]